MPLAFYDTATRATREFVPIVPGKVGIYLCGATVQAPLAQPQWRVEMVVTAAV